MSTSLTALLPEPIKGGIVMPQKTTKKKGGACLPPRRGALRL